MIKVYDGATLLMSGSIDGSGDDAGREINAGTAAGAKLSLFQQTQPKRLPLKQC